ncbi:hypothetical protein [Streptomyces hydrogenans]
MRRHHHPGRLRAPARTALAGILYILWTSAPWRDIPAETVSWTALAPSSQPSSSRPSAAHPSSSACSPGSKPPRRSSLSSPPSALQRYRHWRNTARFE